MIGGTVYAGIYRLVTGHIPEHMDYAIWGLIVGSILVDAEQYFSDIKENTEDLKEQVEKLSRQVDDLKRPER